MCPKQTFPNNGQTVHRRKLACNTEEAKKFHITKMLGLTKFLNFTKLIEILSLKNLGPP